MIEGKITFDRTVRWIIIIAIVVAALLVLDYLSPVLLPFFVAWLFAYLLYPLVKFIQYRLHVKIRAVSIILAMLSVVGVLGSVIWFIVPPMMEEFGMFTHLVTNHVHHVLRIDDVPDAIKWWLEDNEEDIISFLQSEKFMGMLKDTTPQLFNVLGKTMSIVLSIVESFIIVLYMFFILMDYENLSKNWIRIFPKSIRPFLHDLMGDVEVALNNYVRGQGLVALIMGILFCIGFTIIDFPMAIGLGILIGIMDLVPYLHTVALLPAAFLAAMKAAHTGQSFWVVFGGAVAVFCIVQLIIEAIVIPKIMGRKMGLNPAVLLLSLSVWGALLGFIGLIIALPATTIVIAYWNRYVTREELSENKTITDNEQHTEQCDTE